MAIEPGEAWTLLRQGRVSGWVLLRMKVSQHPGPQGWSLRGEGAQACCRRMWETQAGVRNLF